MYEKVDADNCERGNDFPTAAVSLRLILSDLFKDAGHSVVGTQTKDKASSLHSWSAKLE